MAYREVSLQAMKGLTPFFAFNFHCSSKCGEADFFSCSFFASWYE